MGRLRRLLVFVGALAGFASLVMLLGTAASAQADCPTFSPTGKHPFTSAKLAAAVTAAKCVAKGVVLKGEKELPTETKKTADACDAVKASGQSDAWGAIDILAKGFGKTEDALDNANAILRGINTYFVAFANDLFFRTGSVHNDAVTDNSLLVDVLHANGRHGGKGVAYDVGHMYAALGAHNCATAHTAADDVATDYPLAVSATNAFLDKARPS